MIQDLELPLQDTEYPLYRVTQRRIPQVKQFSITLGRILTLSHSRKWYLVLLIVLIRRDSSISQHR